MGLNTMDAGEKQAARWGRGQSPGSVPTSPPALPTQVCTPVPLEHGALRLQSPDSLVLLFFI